MSGVINRFAQHLPIGGIVLDAGCGSGRDTKTFVEMGYSVTAFDASPAMVKHAASYTGLEVEWMTFEDMVWNQRFHGVWCCASLLHIPRRHFGGVLKRLFRALKPDGICYMSFKHGTGDRTKDGRLFQDHTEASLTRAISAQSDFRVIDTWITPDARPDRSSETWLNSIVKRPG
jgi:2-polyprenyl-3-methyl-5-hydroxy-6-metoxy-1,4-benzoquinol methylase